ncbi:hypothetical protein B0T10DRAFT_53886 [Thelonectria olida]|uniref:Secreted protein n=1 Tax=Thelonectria olida TaxID=1576542 RepID=A0A9P8W2Y5_9HYPO|nr:hypothetical protein B0T10DRAFT_53886 [Thelonectria olida]
MSLLLTAALVSCAPMLSVIASRASCTVIRSQMWCVQWCGRHGAVRSPSYTLMRVGIRGVHISAQGASVGFALLITSCFPACQIITLLGLIIVIPIITHLLDHSQQNLGPTREDRNNYYKNHSKSRYCFLPEILILGVCVHSFALKQFSAICRHVPSRIPPARGDDAVIETPGMHVRTRNAGTRMSPSNFPRFLFTVITTSPLTMAHCPTDHERDAAIGPAYEARKTKQSHRGPRERNHISLLP